jgi:hypothetical protein
VVEIAGDHLAAEKDASVARSLVAGMAPSDIGGRLAEVPNVRIRTGAHERRERAYKKKRDHRTDERPESKRHSNGSLKYLFTLDD